MAEATFRELSIDGLWKNNPAIVQLLGLCPLLAVTGSVVNAMGMGLATIMVLTIANTCVSLIRNVVPDTVRLPVFVLIIAAAVTCIELLMQAWSYELYQALGIFLPLITTNCIILGRAEAYASRNPLFSAMYDGFIMGVGFACVLLLLGALRELIGTGALFSNMDLLFGASAKTWKITVFADYKPFLLAILPPGAFIFTGLIIAAKNLIDAQLKNRAETAPAKPVTGTKRVRVTGEIG